MKPQFEIKKHEEPLNGGHSQHFNDEMNLIEAAIIDEQKVLYYVGTSIETRVNKNSKIE